MEKYTVEMIKKSDVGIFHLMRQGNHLSATKLRY